MNYPFWVIPSINGGLLIAIIAIVHVFVAHFAVGGGLFLVLTELKGRRENSDAILKYTKSHAKFFLLLTIVFGSITGVGIWFIISIVSPAGTSVLIHSFVFGWAIEWVFFVGEIVALFIYFYTFDSMQPKTHLLMGWLYFIFAWLSLFIINGIITIMLTSGNWVETQTFWDGFFNPSSMASLAFRTLISVILAGLFGTFTATRIRDDRIREQMVRYSVFWLLGPVILLIGAGYWYLKVIPPMAQGFVLGGISEIQKLIAIFSWLAPALIIGGMIMLLRLPRNLKTTLSLFLLALGLSHMGIFEWIREAARKPYIIDNYMYSNNVLVEQMDDLKANGFLEKAKWIKFKNIEPENRLTTGKELFSHLCLPCHSVSGFINDIVPLTEKFNSFGMDSFLNGMGKINKYMPQFPGKPEERQVLADYIVAEIHGKSLDTQKDYPVPQLAFSIPEFDFDKSEYLILAWNDMGMHCMTDNDKYFSLLPPANTLYAQIIKRGEQPQIITKGITLNYSIEPGFENPSNHVDFWKYVERLFGKKVAKDIGLAGNGLSGKMELKSEINAHVAELLPVVPYSDSEIFNPYPLFKIQAINSESGDLLVETKVVAPVSTEMGCKNCHGGDWSYQNVAGFSDATSLDILLTHDKMNKTNLYSEAISGRPMICQGCHGDHALGVDGKRAVPSLSSAIHGFHANYLTERDGNVCAKCHPAEPKGATQCLRGIHADLGMTCASCHGYLEDHALALLKMEIRFGRKSVAVLMENLKPRSVDSVDEVVSREAWINEPDCMNCHVDYQIPEVDSTFNLWTQRSSNLYRNRTDEVGIMCAACHGSPHAIYPATNPYHSERDVIQPLQYQGNHYPISANKNCKVCHTIDMDMEMHHPNSLSNMRN